MPELVTDFLDRFELALVLGWGAIYFALTAISAYTLQAISDKTDAAPAWMCWVPMLQVHPFLRAAGSSWKALLIWCALSIAVIALGSVASSTNFEGHATVLGVLWILASLVFFGRMFWRLAENRRLSGFVGLACLVPLLGLLFYGYIAFHDGLVRPNPIGLGISLALAIIAAAGLRSDLSDVRAMLGSPASPFAAEMALNPEAIADSMGADDGSGSARTPEAALAESARSVSDGGWLGIASLGPESAKRLYYQFTDERGAVHFVERLDQVPRDWRDRVGYVEMDGPPPGSPGDARRMRGRSGASGDRLVAFGSGSSREPAVLLYYAEWCGYCRKTREELDRRGVSFALLNVEDPATLEELVAKTGQRGVPVLDVGGKILIGYDPQGMDRLLTEAI